MRDIPAEIIIESVDAGVGAMLDLFEVDLQAFGGDVIRFHSGTNGYYGDVVRQAWSTDMMMIMRDQQRPGGMLRKK